MQLHLQSNSIYTNQLNTDNFARMLKDPSQCYKFYWLEAILTLMETTEGDLSFDSINNEAETLNSPLLQFELTAVQ